MAIWNKMVWQNHAWHNKWQANLIPVYKRSIRKDWPNYKGGKDMLSACIATIRLKPMYLDGMALMMVEVVNL